MIKKKTQKTFTKRKLSRKNLIFVSVLCNIANCFSFLCLISLGLSWLGFEFLNFSFITLSFSNFSFFHALFILLVSLFIKQNLYKFLKLDYFIKLRDALLVSVTNNVRRFFQSGRSIINGKNGIVMQNEYCVVFYSYVDRVFCVWDIAYNKDNQKWRYCIKEVIPVYSGFTDVYPVVLSYNFNLVSTCFSQHTRAIDIIKGFDLPENCEVYGEVYVSSFDGVIDKTGYKKLETNSLKNIKDKININSATEEEITDLPGISTILAKRIIRYREENGPFNSIEEFIKTMKIKSHFEQQIRLSAIVAPIEKSSNNNNSQVDENRNLDL